MRNFIHILLAAVALLAGRGYSETDTKSDALTFYVVSDEKLDGGRFIDTPDMPKLGYIAAKPDLVVTKLVLVRESAMRSFRGEIDKDGKITSTPLPAEPSLVIKLSQEDSLKFEAFTKKNIGMKILLMLGDLPLIAPIVKNSIPTGSFEINVGKDGNLKAIEDKLKKLVH